MARGFGLGLLATALVLTGGCGGDGPGGQNGGDDVPGNASDDSDNTGGGQADAAAEITGGGDAQPTEDDATEDVGPDACVPNCEGKACGSDGCGGSCGDCIDNDDPCTDAVCDGGACGVTFTEAACDDDDLCTGEDMCVEGLCTGSPKDCSDDNDCTDNWCNQGFCMIEPSEAEACELVLTIDTPTRAATLQDLDVVVVAGTVSSPAGLIDHVTVGGVDVGVTNEGLFSTTVVPQIGLNILVASATNDIDQEDQVAQSFLYGEAFHPMGTLQDPTMLPGAMGLWLSPDAFDDGNTGDVDDFSTLAWMMLTSVDLNAMIPSPLFPQNDRPSIGWCDYDVEVSDVDITFDEVSFSPVAGGLQAYVEIEDLYAYVSATSDDGIGFDSCPDALGPVTANLVTIDAMLTVEVVDGKPVVSIASPDDLDIELYGFDWTLEGGAASFFDVFMGLVLGTVEDKIVSALQDQVTDSIVPMVNGLLTDFTSFERIFVIPAFRAGGNSAVVNLSAALADADFADTGVHLSLAIGSKAEDEVASDAPGTLAAASCEEDPKPPYDKLPKTSVTEAYLNVDLSNQLLFSLWSSGYTHMTITEDTLGTMAEDYGLHDPHITIAPQLPPVLSTCTTLGDAEIQLGDVHVVAEFDTAAGPLSLDVFASAVVGADLTIFEVDDGPNALGIGAVTPGTVVLDLQSLEGNLVFSDEAIELLLGSILSDILAGDLLSGLVGAFPLPSVPIGGIIPGQDPDATLSFDPHTLNGDGAHLILGGNLATE